MSLYAKDRHKRAAKALGFVLTLGTSEAWSGLIIVLLARLKPEERAKLAYASLMTLEDDQAYQIANAALYGVYKGELVR
ncbi:hypothetical protein [Sulfitobacter guttiformis]|nr:hypothetical protein [Sulfitobacter guttiformis]